MNTETNNFTEVVYQYIAYLVPLGFFLTALPIAITIHERLTLDGYFVVTAIETFLHDGGLGSIIRAYQPLHPVLAGVLSLLLEPVLALKLLSLTAAVGILILLPLLLQEFSGGLKLGLLFQILVAFNPNYFKLSLEPEPHMLAAFFFLLTVWVGLRYLETQSSFFLYLYFLSAGISCFTRFTGWGFPAIMILVISWLKLRNGNSSSLRRSLIGAGAIYIPLIGLNYLEIGSFSPPYKWLKLGEAVITNGLLNIPVNRWYLLEPFSYKGLFDFVYSHPWKILYSYYINFGEILNVFAPGFTSYGYLSWFIGVGILGITLRANQKKELFLLLSCLFALAVSLLGVFEYRYYFYLGILLGGVGLCEVERLITPFRKRYLKSLPREVFTVMLSITFLSFVISGWIQTHTFYFINAYQTQKQREAKKLLNKLRRVVKKPPEKIRVFGWTYLPQIYQVSFRSALIPFPKNTVEEIFCYRVLSKKRRKNYNFYSYPRMSTSRRDFSADYVLVTPGFWQSIVRTTRFSKGEIQKYLREVPAASTDSELAVFRVDQASLSCNPPKTT